MRIDLAFDTEAFESVHGVIQPKISRALYNGLSLSNGVLKVTKGPKGRDGVGGTMNTPGNGVAGTVGQGTFIIRMNSTVTRLETNDPYEEDGGISILDIALNILGRDQL